MVGAKWRCTRWVCVALMLGACGDTGSGVTEASTPSAATDAVVASTTATEQNPENVTSEEGGPGRSFFLPDADPASVQVILLPSDRGEVEARVGPRPDGGVGLCVVDAFGSLPGMVACFEPGPDGRLIVPLMSEGQPTVFIDDRVGRVTVRSDVDPERELQLIDVPGVPGARITQGSAVFAADVNAEISFYDQSGDTVFSPGYVPPRE